VQLIEQLVEPQVVGENEHDCAPEQVQVDPLQVVCVLLLPQATSVNAAAKPARVFILTTLRPGDSDDNQELGE